MRQRHLLLIALLCVWCAWPTAGLASQPNQAANIPLRPPPTKPRLPVDEDDHVNAKNKARAKQKYTDPSLEELESGLRGLRDAIHRFGGQIRSIFHRNRHAIMAAGGVLGLMHGGAAAFTVLFIQSFGASGWPLMQSGLRRGMAAYELAKERAPRETDEYRHEVQHLRKELIGLAEQLAALRREGATEQAQNEVIRQMKRVRREIEAVPPSRRAAPVLVAACDASVVRDVCLGIWSGVTVSLAAACSSAARTIGIGVSLGEAVSKLATVVVAKIEPLMRSFISRLPPEAVMLSYLGPSIVGSATISIIGRSLGCWIAYRLQHLAAVLSVSLLSARMLLESVAPTQTDDADAGRKVGGGGLGLGLGSGSGSGSGSARSRQAEAAARDLAEAAYVATAKAEYAREAEEAEYTDFDEGANRVESREARRRRRLRQRRRRLASRELVKLSSQSIDGRPRAWDFLRTSASTRREAIAWLLAVASLQSQRRRSFRLPLYLKLPLLPIVIAEALLQRLANQLTSQGFPVLGGGGAKGRAARRGANAGGRRKRSGGGGSSSASPQMPAPMPPWGDFK